MLQAAGPHPSRHTRPFPHVAGTAPAWHNYQALPTYRRGGVSFSQATPSLPHDTFLEDFYAHQEPASERARRTLVMRLRAPSFPRAGVLFAARSFAEQRLHPHRIARRPQLDRHLRGLSFRHHPAILWSRIVSAVRLHGHARDALGPIA